MPGGHIGLGRGVVCFEYACLGVGFLGREPRKVGYFTHQGPQLPVGGGEQALPAALRGVAGELRAWVGTLRGETQACAPKNLEGPAAAGGW